MAAITAGVRVIVVAGGLPVSPAIEQAARAQGVTLVSSPHDIAVSVDLARGAFQFGRMLEPENLSFTPYTLLEEVRVSRKKQLLPYLLQLLAHLPSA